MKRWVGAFGASLVFACASVSSATLRVADAGDALSMDPHSFNEGVQLSLTGNVYEPLVTWGKDMSLAPALATRWSSTSPTVWRFELRRGVRFHDGTPFTADDVVFSLRRAAGPGSNFHHFVAPIKAVRKVSDHAVEIETTEPYPILPNALTTIYIMSRSWCLANGAEHSADHTKTNDSVATFKANGTGPFRLRERQPSVRTVLDRNFNYWEPIDTPFDRVEFRPIANDATRVAALLSGEIDVMQPAPSQDVARIARTEGFTVMQRPELRTLFLGMDQKRDELLYSSVKGRNPLKDRRVRQALYQAIDIDAIKTHVMSNAATPAALMVGPGVRGFYPEMNKRMPYDRTAAKALLEQAGYPTGFDIVLHCPNDRYVNDSRLCQAVAAQWARIDVKVTVQLETKSLYFPRLLRRDISFYLLGYAPLTLDAHEVLAGFAGTPGRGQGDGNFGGFSNVRFDEMIRTSRFEMNEPLREQMLREAHQIHQAEVAHIPLHQQAITWALADDLEAVQLPQNHMRFKWITRKGARGGSPERSAPMTPAAVPANRTVQ